MPAARPRRLTHKTLYSGRVFRVERDDVLLSNGRRARMEAVRHPGSVVLIVQPPRGFGENPVAIYHDPDLPPSHHYLAAYRWLDSVFGADAVVHLGKHGNLEWLPGKTLGMSSACGTAFVRTWDRSEPAWGSVRFMVPLQRPESRLGT